MELPLQKLYNSIIFIFLSEQPKAMIKATYTGAGYLVDTSITAPKIMLIYFELLDREMYIFMETIFFLFIEMVFGLSRTNGLAPTIRLAKKLTINLDHFYEYKRQVNKNACYRFSTGDPKSHTMTDLLTEFYRT